MDDRRCDSRGNRGEPKARGVDVTTNRDKGREVDAGRVGFPP